MLTNGASRNQKGQVIPTGCECIPDKSIVHVFFVLVLVHGTCAVTSPPGRRKKSHQVPQVPRPPEKPPAKNSVRVYFSPPAHPHLHSSLTSAPQFPGMPEAPKTLHSLHKRLLNQSPSLRCSAARHTRSCCPTNAFLPHKWVRNALPSRERHDVLLIFGGSTPFRTTNFTATLVLGYPTHPFSL